MLLESSEFFEADCVDFILGANYDYLVSFCLLSGDSSLIFRFPNPPSPKHP